MSARVDQTVRGIYDGSSTRWRSHSRQVLQRLVHEQPETHEDKRPERPPRGYSAPDLALEALSTLANLTSVTEITAPQAGTVRIR